MEHHGWTAEQLEAMTAADRRRLFQDGFVVDVREISSILASQSLDQGLRQR